MKKIAIITIGIVIFVLILIGITFLESLKNKDGTLQNKPQTNQPINSRNNTTQSLKIDSGGSKSLLSVVKNRPTPILSSDSTLRKKLVDSLGGNSGIIFSNENYQLEYFKSPNSFEAKIINMNTSFSKNQVVEYLKSQGFSEDGICKLPLMFTLSPEVSEYLKSTGATFSPVPEFCK